MVVLGHHLHSGFRGASFLIEIRLDTFNRIEPYVGHTDTAPTVCTAGIDLNIYCNNQLAGCGNVKMAFEEA